MHSHSRVLAIVGVLLVATATVQASRSPVTRSTCASMCSDVGALDSRFVASRSAGCKPFMKTSPRPKPFKACAEGFSIAAVHAACIEQCEHEKFCSLRERDIYAAPSMGDAKGMHSAVRFGCSLADTFLDEIKEEVFEAEVMAGVVTDEDEMDAILAATSPEDIPPPPTAHDTHLDQELRGSKAAAEAQAQAEAEAEAQAQAEQAKAKAAEEARVAAEEAAKAKAAEQEARLAAEAEAKAKAAEEARLAAEAEAKAKAAEEARLAAEAQAKAAQEAALRAAREAEAAKNAEAAARAAAQQQRQAEEENEGAAGL